MAIFDRTLQNFTGFQDNGVLWIVQILFMMLNCSGCFEQFRRLKAFV